MTETFTKSIVDISHPSIYKSPGHEFPFYWLICFIINCRMKQWWVLISLLSLTLIAAAANNPHGVDLEDNDFAEFEDFEDEGEADVFTV